MIKKATILIAFLIHTCAGTEITHWGFEDRDRGLVNRFTTFVSELFTSPPPKAATQLPKEVIQRICEHLNGNARDIWSFLRTTSTYAKMAPTIIQTIRSNTEILDLGCTVTYKRPYESDSTIRDKLFAIKLTTHPENFSKLSTLNLNGINAGQDSGWTEDVLTRQNKILFIQNVSKFNSLTSLDLSHNHLDSISCFEERSIFAEQRPSLIETMLNSLPQLQHLDLSYNFLCPATLQSLGSVYPSNLKSLNFSGNAYYSYDSNSNIYHFLIYLNSNTSLTCLKMADVGCNGSNDYKGTWITLFQAALSPNNKLESFDIRDNYIRDMDGTSRKHNITVKICDLLRKNTHIKSLYLPHFLFHHDNKKICNEFLTFLKARNGHTVLDLMNKFRDEKKWDNLYKSPLMEEVEPRLNMLCDLLKESEMTTLAAELMEVWDYNYNEEAITEINKLQNSMNLSLTELYLQDAATADFQDLLWLRDLKAIPGLQIAQDR